MKIAPVGSDIWNKFHDDLAYEVYLAAQAEIAGDVLTKVDNEVEDKVDDEVAFKLRYELVCTLWTAARAAAKEALCK